MPKLDLTKARQIKVAGVEVLQLKGPGFVWSKPTRPELRVSGGVISTFSRGGVDYTQVRFDQSGGFALSDAIAGARYALIGAGGGGGRAGGTNPAPGGGGGGGFRDVSRLMPAGDYSVAVGAPGGGPAANVEGSSGGASTIAGPFADSAPGGGGGGGVATGRQSGLAGGGGGGGGAGTGGAGAGGAGVLGFPGGAGSTGTGAGSTLAGGGGGGASQAGGEATISQGGKGGDGVYLDWVAVPLWVAGGGGGRSSSTGANGRGGGSLAPGGGTQSTSAGVLPDLGGSGALFLIFPTAAAVAIYA